MSMSMLVLLLIMNMSAPSPVQSRKTTGRKPTAGQGIVNAICDEQGAHVESEGGRTTVYKPQHDQMCTDIRISTDRRSVGWVMSYEEVVEDEHGNVIERVPRERLVVNGVSVDLYGSLYKWYFYSVGINNDGGHVVLEVGPAHTGAEISFSTTFVSDESSIHVEGELRRDVRIGRPSNDWPSRRPNFCTPCPGCHERAATCRR
jgi:hypothetical protein